MRALLKAIHSMAVGLALLAVPASSAAFAQKTNGEDTARQTIKVLTKFCLLDLSASEIQAELMNDGWSRIGGMPVDPGTQVGPDIENVITEANRISDRWRFYNHSDYPQIVSFTTSSDKPEMVRDCAIDGDSIDPTALVKVLLNSFGEPIQGKLGLAQWENWLGSGHTLILAKTSVMDHKYNGGMRIVLRKGASFTHQ